MKELRCKNCKKLLGKYDIVHGFIEIKCRYCKKYTRFERIDINLSIKLFNKNNMNAKRLKGGDTG